MPDFRKILLVRTDRIGDVVLTTPAATILKEQFPDAEIHFLTRAYTAPLVELHADVDHVLIYQPEGKHRGFKGHLQLANKLREYQYDAAFLFYPTFSLAWVLFQAAIPVRVGSGFRWYSSLFLNYKHYEHRKTGQRHELEYNIQLINRIVKIPHAAIAFRFQIPEILHDWWQTYRIHHNLPSEYAVVHPGSGGSAPNLTLAQYQQVIHAILSETQLAVLLTGSPDELEVLQSIKNNFADKPVFIIGVDFTLPQLMIIISQAQLFVSTSTGPLHIAAAFNVPVVGFYCPAPPCSPRRWGPYGQEQWTVTPEVTPCRYCKVEQCPHGNCLSHIPPHRIQEIITRRWQHAK